MKFFSNVIDIKDVSFKYENTNVLENINLELKEKDFLTLIGPNGGGKSTLLKLLVGLNKLTSGSIKVLGNKPKDIYKHIGYVPQNTNININFPISVLDVVMMGHGTKKKSIFSYNKKEINCAKDAINKVGLNGFENTKISNLSGGQRQKAFIARAICTNNTKILFLDEPTASIDPKSSQDIYELLRILNQSITIVAVSHDLAFASKYANKIGYVNTTLVNHDSPKLSFDKLSNKDEHFCEIELMSMLSGVSI
ncbi:MAG: Zinc ABC transporter, ATP-binding protein ZnuC [uncultured Campylobacterales bacterium]|uniref:Zinc ABC transporter, ATP-binding protein ZnuC n=1 Tax=uncultured Campylobacterales bacterium TaxID=352960 RepID=A0A6S6SHP4_9BACT|nr:MAG: Zinc ABC transporter, ATP-binding protein ZnuC [uncultured Campylobacterales bacterium]